MQHSTLALTLATILATTGCSSLVTLHPIVTSAESTFDRSLLGVWNQNGDLTYTIWQEDDHYRIALVGKSGATQFEARLLRIGDASFLDLVQRSDDSFMLPVHMVFRVWPGIATMQFAFLETDRLKEQATRELGAQAVENRTIITVPGEATRAFLKKYGADERAYAKPETLHRVD